MLCHRQAGRQAAFEAVGSRRARAQPSGEQCAGRQLACAGPHSRWRIALVGMHGCGWALALANTGQAYAVGTGACLHPGAAGARSRGRGACPVAAWAGVGQNRVGRGARGVVLRFLVAGAAAVDGAAALLAVAAGMLEPSQAVVLRVAAGKVVKLAGAGDASRVAHGARGLACSSRGGGRVGAMRQVRQRLRVCGLQRAARPRAEPSPFTTPVHTVPSAHSKTMLPRQNSLQPEGKGWGGEGSLLACRNRRLEGRARVGSGGGVPARAETLRRGSSNAV